MAERTGQDRADPHDFGWFWRLRDFFGLNSHPDTNDGEGGGDDDGGDREAKLQDWIRKQLQFPDNRAERYRIFREMDSFDLISAIMDVYAEEVTQPDYDRKRAVWVESKHQKMVESANVCMSNVLLEDRIYGIARQGFLLGDDMRRNLYQPGKGVIGWRYADPAQTYRVEDKFDRLVGFKQDGQKFRRDGKAPVSYAWDYVHFRLTGKDAESPYGSSAAAPLFRPWRQLTMFEDADLMYNLRRSSDRNLVLVDTGSMDEVESAERLRRFERRMKRHVFIDPSSPQYKKNYNPLTPIEDVYMAIRGADDATRVESLAGGGGAAMDPARMDPYRNKLFGTSKIPKAYMGFEGDINAKATLMQQDVRFARTMKRGQKMLVYGIRNLLDIHFMLYSPDPHKNEFSIDDNPYTVMMSPIAYLDEMERLELVQLRYSLIEAMAGLGQSLQIDATAWATYILLHYAKLPEDVVTILMRKGDSGVPAVPGSAGGVAPAFGESRNAKGLREKRTLTEEVTKLFGQQQNNGKWKQGYYEPNPDEQKKIAEAIHASPLLRKVIGDIAELHEDDHAAAQQQIDASLLPPRYTVIGYEGEGENRQEIREVVYLSDVVDEGDEASKWKEDTRQLREAQPAPENPITEQQ